MRDRVLAAAFVLLLAPAEPGAAQSEEALEQAFEGRRVSVRIDMPASHKGVDLRFDKEAPLDAGENARRIREHDVSIPEGARVPVTRIKVKDDLIEFHLAGGGFNWNSDTTTESFSASPRSSREQELERRLKSETDSRRRDDMEDELRDLRRERERRDDRRRREVEERNRLARERDRERALRSGSRFNLRFKKRVPPDALTADGLQHYLSPWVDFTGTGKVSPETVGRFDPEPGEPADEPAGSEGGWGGGAPAGEGRAVRKGMLREAVEERLGAAVREEPCPGTSGDLDCVVAVYGRAGSQTEATFVEGVLVRQRRR